MLDPQPGRTAAKVRQNAIGVQSLQQRLMGQGAGGDAVYKLKADGDDAGDPQRIERSRSAAQASSLVSSGKLMCASPAAADGAVCSHGLHPLHCAALLRQHSVLASCAPPPAPHRLVVGVVAQGHLHLWEPPSGGGGPQGSARVAQVEPAWTAHAAGEAGPPVLGGRGGRQERAGGRSGRQSRCSHRCPCLSAGGSSAAILVSITS